MSANFSEGHRWATALLATLEPAKTPAVPAPLRAMAQWTAASLLWGHPSSLGLAEAALQTFRELGDAHGVARALHAMGDILGWQRHPARVAELAAEAAPIFRRVGDTRNFEKAIGLLGLAYEFAGHPARADAALAEAQSCAEAAGDVWAIGNAHSALANVAERRGDWAAAERYWQAALACYRALGSATQVRALFGLAVCATARGDLGTAAQRIGEALDEARNAGYPGGLARVLVYVGDLARVRGDLEAAHAHCAEAHEYVRRALDAFPQLGWWGASAARLGSLAAEAGDARAAREYLKESLELSVAPNLDDGLAYVLEELATLEAATVEPHRALQLAGAAAALRRPGDQTRLFSADKERYQQRLDAARRRLSPDEAESAFAGGKALTREEAITLARSVLENAQQMTSALPRRDHIPSS